MTMSVSTLMIFKGAATPSSVVNLSMSSIPVEQADLGPFLAGLPRARQARRSGKIRPLGRV
jgi:hypothetical protein